jgi:hypothetical protein
LDFFSEIMPYVPCLLCQQLQINSSQNNNLCDVWHLLTARRMRDTDSEKWNMSFCVTPLTPMLPYQSYITYMRRDGGMWWRSSLRHCATSRQVAVSIPDGVTGIFHSHKFPAALWPWCRISL